MKKIFLLLLLFAVKLSYAETKSSTKIIVRDKCDIIYSNTYTYCIDHGSSAQEAGQIASAAKCACKDISIASN